jgi:hypothetical protein
MKQITLRGIPENIENIAQEEAKARGVSLNKAFISLLRKGADQQRRKSPRAKSEFGRFLGLWNEEEAVSFDESLRQQREIDKDLWS